MNQKNVFQEALQIILLINMMLVLYCGDAMKLTSLINLTIIEGLLCDFGRPR